MTEKILEAYIPPFDKEEVDKLELDWMVSKLFHILVQVTIKTYGSYFCYV